MPKNNGRQFRVSSFLHRQLAVRLPEECRDPRITRDLSITSVDVSPDLAFADVYVSSHACGSEDSGALLKALNGSARRLRASLAKVAAMRTVPVLRFHYDASYTNGLRVSSLIEAAIARDRKTQEISGEGVLGEAALGENTSKNKEPH